ncbi:hypothetical protein J6590_008734 [Homalodisca vitripennis]|nr:hypothetical protein J6590_008732 [Homalodisca vitripennis]KAG8259698.1 hypothetical protein J6590_008734 [Homalodisca vitripennis]
MQMTRYLFHCEHSTKPGHKSQEYTRKEILYKPLLCVAVTLMIRLLCYANRYDSFVTYWARLEEINALYSNNRPGRLRVKQRSKGDGGAP